MPDFIFFMHHDAQGEDEDAWGPYFARLRALGAFEGGSAIGKGASFRKIGVEYPATAHLVGFIRVTAEDFAAAKALLDGNPVYEAGGTVEIRELPKT
jgi:hypothetical protein